MKHQFSLCLHCGAAVDLKDTFRDKCPECGQDARWNDKHEDLEAFVQARQREAAE